MPVGRFSHLSTHEEKPRHQDHIAMNVRIFGNLHKCHNQNEAKAMNCVKKKL
jgi:hypothetical protein